MTQRFNIQSSEGLGSLVRQARKYQHLTLEDVAGLTGLGTRFISELERGKTTAQLEKTLLVLRVLGIPLYAEVAWMPERQA
ncbi:MAG: helix-turn-helix domain-containing protein [Vampirovibrionales bacterium]